MQKQNNGVERAINIAIENGWNPVGQNFSLDNVSYKVQATQKIKFKERFLLDPLFWQSLGKGLGWNKPHREWECHTPLSSFTIKSRWANEMFNFIDHISSGKDIDSFFNEIIQEIK